MSSSTRPPHHPILSRGWYALIGRKERLGPRSAEVWLHNCFLFYGFSLYSVSCV